MGYSLSTCHSTCWCDLLHAKADQSFEWKKRIRFCGFLFLEMAACDWPCEMQYAFYYTELQTQNVNIKWWAACFITGFAVVVWKSDNGERQWLTHAGSGCLKIIAIAEPEIVDVCTSHKRLSNGQLFHRHGTDGTASLLYMLFAQSSIHSLAGVYIQILDRRANEFVNQFAFAVAF